MSLGKMLDSVCGFARNLLASYSEWSSIFSNNYSASAKDKGTMGTDIAARAMPLESDININVLKFHPSAVTDETQAFNNELMKKTEGMPKWYDVSLFLKCSLACILSFLSETPSKETDLRWEWR